LRAALLQGAAFAAFAVLPAAAVLFLTAGLDAASYGPLLRAYLFFVVPAGIVSALFAGLFLRAAASSARRLTDADEALGPYDPPGAGTVRAFPPLCGVVSFACAFLAYVAAGISVPGASAVVIVVGGGAAVLCGLASYFAAENFLVPLFYVLARAGVRFAERGTVSLGARVSFAAVLGTAAVLALAAGPALVSGGISVWRSVLVAAVLLVLAGVGAYVFSRRVSVALKKSSSSTPIPFYYGDEVEGVTTFCHKFVGDALAYENTVRRVTEDLSGQSGRVRESLTQQASIAAQQASAISETSVTMKELAGTVKQTASRAEEISGRVEASVKLVKAAENQILRNADRIDRLAAESQDAAKLAVSLNESARRMDEIVALVNDLAEQSTVLALNAAIEAAKAGEFGRGFSAVAREVKNLAGSSKEGTEGIRKVLTEIRGHTVKTVTSSRESAEQSSAMREGALTAKNLVEEIVPLVEEIGRMSKQIAASARQQSLGLEQVTTAVDNINDAAAEALDQAKAVRGAVDTIAQVSMRLAEESDAPWHWRRS
jgi:methyl-accepting chemotaxis protein